MTEGMEIPGFWANYCDWRLVKTRGIVQVVFEVPLHEADHAYKILGGMPDYSKERPFGIAALDMNVTGTTGILPANRGVAIAATPRKSAAPEKMLAQQAGMACADPRFQEFCRVNDEDGAAAFVRNVCYVPSRSFIRPGTEAGDLWEKLYQEFLIWRTDQDMGVA